MEIGVLGPLEVVAGDLRLSLGTPRQRAVLAVLLVHVNEVVSLDRLIDLLWGETPPSAATASLQAYVSNLRRVLEPDRAARQPPTVLMTEPPGYVLRVPAEAVDAVRFERLAADGHDALERGEPERARRVLESSLELWRGDAFADFAYEPFAAAEIARLTELRANAAEDRVVAMLLLDETAAAVATLESLVLQSPLREGLRELQLLSLYRSGRQADALRAYDETRRALAEELGVEPGPGLRALHHRILDQDPELSTNLGAVVGTSATRQLSPRAEPLAAPSQPSTFVGRAGALELMERAFDGAVSGSTQIVLVGGEAGIGKTRLVGEFTAGATRAGACVAWGRCHEDEGAAPLWPWMQLLRAAGIDGEALAVGVNQRGVDDDGARFRFYDSIRSELDRAAESEPLVLVIDDLQWADLASLRLLRFLAVELRRSRIVIAITLRDESTPSDALDAALADLARVPTVIHVPLHGLDLGDIVEFIQATTDLNAEQAAAIGRTVHDRTDGNPFFVTELVRLCQSEQRLTDDLGATEVPTVVGDVVRRRIRRLPDELQTVLGVAAVIGREFDLDVLGEATGLDADRLLDALDPALLTRLVSDSGEDRFRFAHALVSETIAADLGTSRRARLHGRAGEAIEAARKGDLDPHASRLAHHFNRAGADQAGKALRYSRVAAEQANLNLAFDEEAQWWQSALDALGRTDPGDPAERIRILLARGRALLRAGRPAEITAVQHEAIELAEAAGEFELLGEAGLVSGYSLLNVVEHGHVDDVIIGALHRSLSALPAADGALRCRLLAGLSIALYHSDERRQHALELAQQAIEMGARLHDGDVLIAVISEVMVMLDAGEIIAAFELLSTDEGFVSTAESEVLVRTWNAMAHLVVADGADLDYEVEAALRIAVERRDQALGYLPGWLNVTRAFVRGRLDDAERLAGEMLALHERLGYWGGAALYGITMILIWREQDRLLELEPLIIGVLDTSTTDFGTEKLRSMFAAERGDVEEIRRLLEPDTVPRTHNFLRMIELALLAEFVPADLPWAREAYELLLPERDRVVTMSIYCCLGSAAHYLGVLADRLGEHTAAVEHLEQAVAINDRIGAVPWAVRSRAALADSIGDEDPARAAGLRAEALDAARAHGLIAMERRLENLIGAKRTPG